MWFLYSGFPIRSYLRGLYILLPLAELLLYTHHLLITPMGVHKCIHLLDKAPWVIQL